MDFGRAAQSAQTRATLKAKDSKRINALYALWGLLAPLSVLAWFGARDLFAGSSRFEIAPQAPDYVMAAHVDEPPARSSEAWEVHCYLSSRESSRFLPAETFAGSALPANQSARDAAPGAALLASSASAANPFRLNPDLSPSEDTGHDYPTFCP
jgi:hypothetical protein